MYFIFAQQTKACDILFIYVYVIYRIFYYSIIKNSAIEPNKNVLLNLNLVVIFHYSVKPTNKQVDIIIEAAYKFR